MIQSLDTFIPKAYESIGSTSENHSNYVIHQKGGRGNIIKESSNKDKGKSKKSNYGIPSMYYSSINKSKCKKRNCNKDVLDIFDNQAIDDNIMNGLFESSMHKYSSIRQNPSKLNKSRKLNNLKKHRENPKTKKRVR